MRRLLFLLCLAASTGCAADKGSWAEAMKDWRGDNMQMRSGSSSSELSSPSQGMGKFSD
jgi:hypothetical protein